MRRRGPATDPERRSLSGRRFLFRGWREFGDGERGRGLEGLDGEPELELDEELLEPLGLAIAPPATHQVLVGDQPGRAIAPRSGVFEPGLQRRFTGRQGELENHLAILWHQLADPFFTAHLQLDTEF